MSWREKLRPASFKGALFKVDDVDTKSGRRIASFEFPKLNTPATEDMGRKQRIYSVQAYVIGENYTDDLEALITACESDGAGIFVHPFMGEINVLCEEIVFKHSLSRDGNMALVSLSFIEAGKELYPDALEDKSAALTSSKSAAINVANKDFAKKFSVAGKGQFLVSSAGAQVAKWTSKMTASLSGAKGEAGSIAGMSYAIRNMQANIGDTAKSPFKLATVFSDNITSLKNSFSLDNGGTKASYSSYKKLFSTDNSSSYNTNPLTQTRVQELKNQKAIDDHGRTISTLEAVEVSTQIQFDSHEEAVNSREELLEQLDKIAETASDDLYFEISKIRTLLIDLVPPKGQSLPMLKQIKTLETENVLAFSYRVFGDLSKVDQITSRNKIKNPLFMPSDKTLEVAVE